MDGRARTLCALPAPPPRPMTYLFISRRSADCVRGEVGGGGCCEGRPGSPRPRAGADPSPKGDTRFPRCGGRRLLQFGGRFGGGGGTKLWSECDAPVADRLHATCPPACTARTGGWGGRFAREAKWPADAVRPAQVFRVRASSQMSDSRGSLSNPVTVVIRDREMGSHGQREGRSLCCASFTACHGGDCRNGKLGFHARFGNTQILKKKKKKEKALNVS